MMKDCPRPAGFYRIAIREGGGRGGGEREEEMERESAGVW